MQCDETQRKRTGLNNYTKEHRHLNSEKGGEYYLFLNLQPCYTKHLHLNSEKGGDYGAAAAKRCSSAGECWNTIPTCGRHLLGTTWQQARTALASGHELAHNEGTRKSCESSGSIDHSELRTQQTHRYTNMVH